MTEYADLEIGLHRRDAGSYTVEMRASQPGNEGDVRRQGLARFELEALRGLAAQPEAYGRALHSGLFGDPAVRTGFLEAYAVAQAAETPLRLRLLVGATAPELNDLRWELLRDSASGEALFTGERLLFSRYLSSPDWRRVRLRPQGELRALALAANPSDLGTGYDLPPIDAEGELARLQSGLGGIPLTALPDPASGQRATLSNLMAKLRAENYDIVYLVCHGAIVKGEPWLWLEGDDGKVALTAGSELVARLREMPQCPRLMILGSCQSAGTGLGEALVALGPRLVEAGVPAVIAMQGKVGLETIARFTPVFFGELRKSGNLDQAMAAARGAIRDLPDYWMPALFMRLKSGRIWYVPGFSDSSEEFEKWQSLAGFIQEGTCTPILGSGLLEPYFGTAQEIAHQWADQYGYPLEASDQEDLARVAQYVGTRYDQAYLRLTLRQTLGAALKQHFGTALPQEMAASAWTSPKLLQALNSMGALRRKQVPNEAHRTLAAMRLPLYLTANPDDLLAEALREAGADPQVRLCPWNRLISKPKCQYDETPTPERPLVYHLFGHLNEPYSIVLTQDEYFDYLIGVTTNKDLIPAAVRAALTGTALLFVGFQIDDWDFRILFRSLMAQEGSELGKLLYSHVAAQVEPEEGRLLDPRRARRYLEKYFESEKINLYWGGTEEFMRALAEHLNEKAPARV